MSAVLELAQSVDIPVISHDWVFKMGQNMITNPVSAWRLDELCWLWVPEGEPRADGRCKGEPRWPEDDRVFVTTTDEGLCFAEGLVAIPSNWDDAEQRWEFALDLQIVRFKGAVRVRSHGVKLRQGCRQQIKVPFAADGIAAALRT